MKDYFAPHPVLFTTYTANIVAVNSMGRSPSTNEIPPTSKYMIYLGMYHSYAYIVYKNIILLHVLLI